MSNSFNIIDRAILIPIQITVICERFCLPRFHHSSELGSGQTFSTLTTPLLEERCQAAVNVILAHISHSNHSFRAFMKKRLHKARRNQPPPYHLYLSFNMFLVFGVAFNRPTPRSLHPRFPALRQRGWRIVKTFSRLRMANFGSLTDDESSTCKFLAVCVIPRILARSR